MNVDDVLFAPIGMAQEDKDFLWEIITKALNNLFDSSIMEEFKEQYLAAINKVGPIDIRNKSDIRAVLDEKCEILKELHTNTEYCPEH